MNGRSGYFCCSITIPPLATCVLACWRGIKITTSHLVIWYLFVYDLRIRIVLCVAEVADTIVSLLHVFGSPRRIIFCGG